MTAPTLTLAEAARATGLSQSTLRRKRPQLAELGAEQTPQGWRIPVPALVQLGLMTPTTAPDTVTASDSPVTPDVERLRLEVEHLRAELGVERQRAAVAEAVAVERDRIIEHLKAIEAPVSTTVSTATPDALAPEPAPAKRRWWRL